MRARRFSLGGVVPVAALLTAAATSSGVQAGPTPQHTEAVHHCADGTRTYSFHDSPNAWGTRDDRVEEAIGVFNYVRKQDGSQAVNLQRVANNSSASVKVSFEALGPMEYGEIECDGQDTIKISTLYDGLSNPNKFYWYIGSHEMLHLAGAWHSGKYDSFVGSVEQHPDGTRMMTCISTSSMKDSFAGSNDDVAYLNYLWGNPADRQLTADSGFESGFSSLWWKIGSGSFSIGSHSNAFEGSNRAYYTPPSETGNSIQNRVRMITGNGNEKYWLSVALAPSASNMSVSWLVNMWGRYTNFGPDNANNNCQYVEGMESRDLNLKRFEGGGNGGSWVIRRQLGGYLGVGANGWYPYDSSATKYDPPTADAWDFSVWFQGYADPPGTSPGTILLDNLTIIGS